jgi:magnesium-transporting ATPase (P-type)
VAQETEVHDTLLYDMINSADIVVGSISLVPGDIVLVSEGQVVPADLRIIRTWSCWLENGHATWTTARWASTSSDGNTNWLNSPNMAYQKMWINSQGYLIGVVLATGETTVANTQYYYHYPLKVRT